MPEWYFLPYYAILRAIPNKLLGVIAMFSSILILLCSCPGSIPRACARPSTARSTSGSSGCSSSPCVALGYLGSKPPEGAYVFWARVFTAYYFLHFLVVMPIVGVIGDAHAAAALDQRSRCWARAAKPVRVGAPAAPERR